MEILNIARITCHQMARIMDTASLIHISAWLLAAAGLAGTWMAGLRYAKDRSPPKALLRLHGLLALAGLALLVYGWVTMSMPRLAVMATVLLLAAATGGLTVGQAWRWKWAPSIETLVFGHMSLAAGGYLLLLAASMSRA